MSFILCQQYCILPKEMFKSDIKNVMTHRCTKNVEQIHCLLLNDKWFSYYTAICKISTNIANNTYTERRNLSKRINIDIDIISLFHKTSWIL